MSAATAFATLTPFVDAQRRRMESFVLSVVQFVRDPEPEMRRRSFLHYAYWVVLAPALLSKSGGPERKKGALLFMSAFTGDLEDYLMGFTDSLPSAMDRVWGQCTGWPGAADFMRALRFVERYAKQSAVFYDAYGDARIEDIRNAMRLRTELDRFATESCHMTDREFEARYREMLAAVWGNGICRADQEEETWLG
jgi:hypothetical protein